MKLFHLSDLHIGKRVNEFSMLEDQKYILMQILKAAKEHQPDGIILAGDIYDKPVPAAEAVQVFDDFLTSLNEMGLIVFMISGNHDSPERVSYGGRLMKKSGIYVAPVYEGKTEKVEFTDAYGKVCIHLLPFVKPAVVRHAFEEGEFEKEAEAVCDYQSAVKMTVSHMAVDTDVRNVLIAHQFVTGAMRCESEEVSVGGLDNVDASVFDGFDYVALGHIHKYKKGSIDSRGVYCYSGCLEARGFDECGEKGFVLLDTAAAVSGSAGSGTENIAAESPECGTARKIAARFVPFAKRKAWEITVDCTDIVTTPQLYETVKTQIAKRALEEQTEPADSQDMIRVVLTGAKQSQAAYDMDYIKKYLEQEYYLVRLKDETGSVREESGFEAYLEKYIMDSDETEDMKQEILACVKAALSQN